MPDRCTAVAHPNIALVKYWGKRDAALNLPAAGSISITLDTLATRTQVTRGVEADCVVLDGRAVQDPRVTATIDRIRALAGSGDAVRVESENNFPTAAGLASSASGFAALVTALCGLFGLDLDLDRRSVLARLGSGSAARSIHGGFVEMRAGEAADGSDAYARPLLAPERWPLVTVIAITSEAPKAAGSTDGMLRSRETSPYYPAWISSTREDLDLARAAIDARDFAALAGIAEHSCLKMHATMMTSRPPLLYWKPATLAAVHRVSALRKAGARVFYTIDAGPQLKAICHPEDAPAVARELAGIPGVVRVMQAGLGPGAHLEDRP